MHASIYMQAFSRIGIHLCAHLYVHQRTHKPSPASMGLYIHPSAYLPPAHSPCQSSSAAPRHRTYTGTWPAAAALPGRLRGGKTIRPAHAGMTVTQASLWPQPHARPRPHTRLAPQIHQLLQKGPTPASHPTLTHTLHTSHTHTCTTITSSSPTYACMHMHMCTHTHVDDPTK